MATYSCTQDGYTVLGDGTRLCGVSGAWSGADPACVPRGMTTYTVLGDRTRLCGVSGAWSGADPVCVPRGMATYIARPSFFLP